NGLLFDEDLVVRQVHEQVTAAQRVRRIDAGALPARTPQAQRQLFARNGCDNEVVERPGRVDGAELIRTRQEKHRQLLRSRRRLQQAAHLVRAARRLENESVGRRVLEEHRLSLGARRGDNIEAVGCEVAFEHRSALGLVEKNYLRQDSLTITIIYA